MSATWPYMASDPYFVGLTRFLSLNPPTCFNIIKTRIGWKVRKISKAQCLVSIPLTWIHTQWQICSNLYPICEVPLWSDSIGWVASSASPNQPFPSILMGTLHHFLLSNICRHVKSISRSICFPIRSSTSYCDIYRYFRVFWMVGFDLDFFHSYTACS